MIKVNIFYPNKAGAKFDWDYYLNMHMPRAVELLGSSMRGVSVERGIGGALPGTEAAYVAMCNYAFDSVEAFLAAFMPHAEELQGDIAKFTDIEPVIQYSDVTFSR